MRRNAVSPAGPLVVAADLGGTKLALAVCDEAGGVSRTRSFPVDISSPKRPIQQILHYLEDVRKAGFRPRAIGVAVPGLVRSSGTVWAPNLPGWERMPLARELQSRSGLRIAVESDRNAAVIGEAWRGAARGKSDVIVLIVGTGIGAGILSGGRLVRGAHELSGCAGWLVVSDEIREEAKRCGALEALVAGPAIGRRASEAFGSAMSAEELAERAREGDAEAKRIFAECGRLLGRGVANLISLFDPETIVLTGGTAGAADLFLGELQRTALERAQPLSAPQVRIVVTRIGAKANLLGAARIAWDALAQRPKKKTNGKRAGR